MLLDMFMAAATGRSTPEARRMIAGGTQIAGASVAGLVDSPPRGERVKAAADQRTHINPAQLVPGVDGRLPPTNDPFRFSRGVGVKTRGKAPTRSPVRTDNDS